MKKLNSKLFKIAANSYLLKREPVSLVHFITNKCNARCKHCFIDFKNPELFKNELSLNEIEKLSKTFGKSIFNVNITGGEPFLREDIFEIVNFYFKNAGVKSIFISTNGMFTQKIREFIDKIISYNLRGNIIFSISLDNFEKKHDENRRVRGLFKNAIKTYRMIESYSRRNIMCNIGITVSHHNYPEVLRLYDYLKEQKIKSFTATIMREEGIVKSMDKGIKRRILKSYSELTRRIHNDQKKKITKGFGYNIQAKLMSSKNILMNRIIREIYLQKKFVSFCPSASLFGVIYANGDVYPCEILDNFKLGNLRDYGMNFMRLWKNQKTQRCRDFIKKSRCTCTFECAWTLNIISNFKFIPSLFLNCLRV